MGRDQKRPEETRRGQLCFDPISRVGSDCFPFGFQHTLSTHVTFYHNSQHFLQRTILKQFHRSNKINTSSAPFVDTSKTLLLYDNASVDKAKVAVTFLKPPPPLLPRPGSMWLLIVLPLSKLAGRKFSSFQDLVTAIKSELLASSPSDYQNAFETWSRRLELCVRSWREYFEGLWVLLLNGTATASCTHLRTHRMNSPRKCTFGPCSRP